MLNNDFTLLASALADAHAQIIATPYITDQLSAMTGHRLACESLADTLHAANPHFDREHFLAACTSSP